MKELASALVKASSAIGGAVKDKANPFFKSKYADLSSVVEAIKPHLAANGLTFYQQFGTAEGGVMVETVIVHESGQMLPTGGLFVPASKADAQGYGSAITYARRYSLQTAFGVPSEDDDGNAAAKASHAPVAATMAHEGIEVSHKVSKIVDAIRGHLEAGNDYGVLEEEETMSQEEKIAAWSLLTSGEKSKIKKIKAEAKAAA